MLALCCWFQVCNGCCVARLFKNNIQHCKQHHLYACRLTLIPPVSLEGNRVHKHFISVQTGLFAVSQMVLEWIRPTWQQYATHTHTHTPQSVRCSDLTFIIFSMAGKGDIHNHQPISKMLIPYNCCFQHGWQWWHAAATSTLWPIYK